MESHQDGLEELLKLLAQTERTSLADRSSNGDQIQTGKFSAKKKAPCTICLNPNYVQAYHNFGPLCQNCRKFACDTLKKNKRLKCPAGGLCSTLWAPNRIICSACRWTKIASNPNFEREFLSKPTASAHRIVLNASTSKECDQEQQSTSRPSQIRETAAPSSPIIRVSSNTTAAKVVERKKRPACEICDYPKSLKKQRFGLICCYDCVLFIRRTITERIQHVDCRLSAHNCTIKWIASDVADPCAACRWRRVKLHPNHTQESTMGRLIWVSKSFVAPQTLSEGQLICSICAGTHRVLKSAYGPTYCRDCVNFVGRTLEKSSIYSCSHEDNSMSIEVIGKRRYIMCESCAWHKIKSDPSFKKEMLPSLVRNVSSSNSTAAQNRELDTTRKRKVCEVCKGTEFVQERFGLDLCEDCLIFLDMTKRRNMTYDCLAQGNCDITWDGHDISCQSCHLRAIIENPKFEIESLF